MWLNDIDFATLYRQHMAEVGRPKTPEMWDARAAKLGADTRLGDYGQELMRRLDLAGCQSVLDVGCGAGPITLELARHVPQVYGMDFSPGMLACLQRQAQASGQAHVQALLKSWDDDWHDVPVCDVVLASRSTAVMDMGAALKKLHDHARQRVYLTSLVGGEFAESRLQGILGRGRKAPWPDYPYIINILAQMGCQPELSYIDCASPYSGATSLEAFVAAVESGLGPLSSEELGRLHAWVQQRGSISRVNAALSHRWALISWSVA